MRKNVASGSPLEADIGFSRAVRVGRNVSVAGTAPIPQDGAATPVGCYAQTRLCIEIGRAALEEAGASLRQVTRTRIMLTDISDWKEAARAHGEVFADIRPACTFVEVSGFIDPAWLVETEMEAIIA